jgi:GAF domain-containing protein
MEGRRLTEKKERDVPEMFTQAEEVVRTFTKGRRFAEELLRENERLRYKIFHMQQERTGSTVGESSSDGDIEEENRRLKRELEEIKDNFSTLNRENKDFQSRYEEVEKQNENLLNLYVSGYQMHSTLQETNVLAVIQEIILNLLGGEIFVLWAVNQETGELETLIFVDEKDKFGGSAPQLPTERREEMASGESWFAPEDGHGSPPGDLLACIPLQLEEKTLGVLAIYKLLEQKERLTSLDQELMGLLTAQAATAIIGSMAVSRSGKALRWLETGIGQSG